MSFAAEIADINEAVVDAFETTATLVGPGDAITGVFRGPFEPEGNYGVDTEIPDPSFWIRTADLGAIANGDELDIDGRRFEVVDVQSPYGDMTRLQLQEFT